MFWVRYLTGPGIPGSLCPAGFYAASAGDRAISDARALGGFAMSYGNDDERARILRRYAGAMRALAALNAGQDVRPKGE